MKVFFGYLIAIGFLAAQQKTATPNSATRGQQQFKQACAFCHGVSGDGGAEGPSLIRSGLVRHDKDGELIGPVIRDGRPEKGMPRIPLTQEQIADTVAYIHGELKKLDRTSPGRPSRDHYSLKLLLVGDAAAGKVFFENAGGCSGCHSPAGDLAGIAKKYLPPDLQSRFLYPTGKLPSATVTLKSGAQVRGLVMQQDAFYIAVQDAEGWNHSWPVDTVKVEETDPLAAHKALLRTISDKDVHNVFAYLETLN